MRGTWPVNPGTVLSIHKTAQSKGKQQNLNQYEGQRPAVVFSRGSPSIPVWGTPALVGHRPERCQARWTAPGRSLQVDRRTPVLERDRAGTWQPAAGLGHSSCWSQEEGPEGLRTHLGQTGKGPPSGPRGEPWGTGWESPDNLENRHRAQVLLRGSDYSISGCFLKPPLYSELLLNHTKLKKTNTLTFQNANKRRFTPVDAERGECSPLVSVWECMCVCVCRRSSHRANKLLISQAAAAAVQSNVGTGACCTSRG